MKFILLISVVLNFVLLLFLLRKRKSPSVNISHESKDDDVSAPDTKKRDVLQDRLYEFKTFAGGIANEENNGERLLSKIAFEIQAVQGALYLLKTDNKHTFLRFHCGYAFYCPESKPLEFEIGEGLIGQVAKDKKILNLNTAPEEHLPAISGLGGSIAQYLIICPLIKNGETFGVAEFSAFHPFHEESEKFIEASLVIVIENLHT